MEGKYNIYIYIKYGNVGDCISTQLCMGVKVRRKKKLKLQIRMVRLIRRVWRATFYRELFKTLNILPVPYIYVCVQL